MKKEHLQEAKQEAERFLSRVKDLESKIKNDKGIVSNYGDKPYVSFLPFSKEKAGIKRSSMDLTRALAKMRQDT